MSDEDFAEPFAAPEFYVDGFTNHAARDGVMTCIGYRNMSDGKQIVVRLVWPMVNTMAAVEDAEAALAKPRYATGDGSKRGVH